jgi:hypothetical protein
VTESVVASTEVSDSEKAGAELGARISEGLHGERPDALILFASSKYDYSQLLRALDAACRPTILVGCSSAGEFTNEANGEGLACAVALRSDQMRFSASVGRGLRTDRAAAARDLTAGFQGPTDQSYQYRSALILTDALAAHADDLVEQLTVQTAGTYQLFGGGAGDDAKFFRTHVFHGTEALPDSAVALEILSNQPLGVGVGHGWQPAGPAMRVTEADAMRLVSLNATPAVEAFQEHAELTGQRFDPADPVPFFLHNVLGIDTGSGYRLRVPLAVNSDGSISCASNVPTGATVRIMSTTNASAVEAASTAIQEALKRIEGRRPKLALFFDCAATRLRMGKEFGIELNALQEALPSAQYAGCNTYGQIARAEGQFGGFHNCTAVICLIPE